MIRMLISAAVHLAANAVGLLVAALVLEDMTLDATAFVLAVLIFTVVEVLARPFLVSLAMKGASYLQGATALVAALLFVAIAGEAMLTGSLPTLAPAPGGSQEAARVVETVVVEKEGEQIVQEVPAAMAGPEEPVGEGMPEAAEAPMAQQVPEAEVAVTQEMEAMKATAPEAAVEEQANQQLTPGIGGAAEGEAATAADVYEDGTLSPTPAPQGTPLPPDLPLPAASVPETDTQRAMVAPTATLLPSLAVPDTAVTASASAEGELALGEAPPLAVGGGRLDTGEGRSVPGWLRVVEYGLGVVLILLTGTTIGLMVWRRQVG